MTAAIANPAAREFLRNADPILARVIDAHPGFRPRAWIGELPALDAFGTLTFQVAGQQLSVRAPRTILSRPSSTSADTCGHPRSCSQRTRTSSAQAASRHARARRCARSRNASLTDA
jgi:hypothetical protein